MRDGIGSQRGGSPSAVSLLITSKPAVWGATHCSRENLSAASFALSFTIALTEPLLLGLPMALFLCGLILGIYFSPICRRWDSTAILGLVICGSALAAIPISAIAGRNVYATAFLASMTCLMASFLFVDNSKRIFYALIPAWYLQAGMMAWEWVNRTAYRVDGIAGNENAGSAFLLLGAIFLAHDRRLKWLSVPLLIVIPFSGSRWVAAVAVALFAMVYIARKVPWKYLLIGTAVMLMSLFAAQFEQIKDAYFLPRTAESRQDNLVEQNGHDAAARLAPGGALSPAFILVPMGFYDSHIHSVPLRMATETGLISALAWSAASGIALWNRPRSWAWWCMAAICLLSLMYYHTWVGPLGAFWWLLLGELSRQKERGP